VRAGTLAAPARVTLWLRVGAIICAAVSLVALLAHVGGVFLMGSFLTFLGVPSLLLLFCLAALGRWLDARVFVTCLAVGLLGGVVATLAYDVTRLLFRSSRLFDYDGFVSIYIFGSWISGRPTDSWEATVAGWGYHFWNGISFGIFYTLAFGRRRWLWGVGYGAVMEASMLGLFPLFVPIVSPMSFVVISMIGHLVYGGVLGRIAQRYALNWLDAG